MENQKICVIYFIVMCTLSQWPGTDSAVSPRLRLYEHTDVYLTFPGIFLGKHVDQSTLIIKYKSKQKPYVNKAQDLQSVRGPLPSPRSVTTHMFSTE